MGLVSQKHFVISKTMKGCHRDAIFNAHPSQLFPWPVTMEIILGLLGVALIGLAIFAYSFAKRPQCLTSWPSRVLPLQSGQTKLDRLIEPLTSTTPNASGLFLLAENINSFAARLDSANYAQRSLDLQYYYWKNDLTGKLLCRAIVEAAERGVRVRLLLDDINAHGLDTTYLALDSHNNIEVRLYNPATNRGHRFRRSLELIFRYASMSRRMHNKSWIADGRMAIVGGRNIGDAYFDASESVSFRDIDVLVIGRAVSDAEQIFDRYWNSSSSLSIRALHRIRNPKLKRLMARLESFYRSYNATRFMNLVRDCESCKTVFQVADNFHWTNEASIVADPPNKVKGDKSDILLAHKIQSLMQSAAIDIEIVSPYFIPGYRGVAQLQSIVSRGVNVSVLTNSLAATDVIAVHGAYAKYRKPILESGVTLFELKQRGIKKKSSLFGSSSASLHTKSFVIDDCDGFIGSFNLDPRSTAINTEMGVFFRHPVLARELKEIFQLQTSSKFSYRIQLHDGALRWDHHSNSDGNDLTHEPETSFARRLLAQLVGMLPIESQL